MSDLRHGLFFYSLKPGTSEAAVNFHFFLCLPCLVYQLLTCPKYSYDLEKGLYFLDSFVVHVNS